MYPRNYLLGAIVIAVSTLSMAANYSTPENALKALEDAYIRKDIEAAVAAKDFTFEAREMLRALKNLPSPDEELVRKTAEVLELSFRKQMKQDGFPDFTGLRCAVVKSAEIEPGLSEMIEECVFPDGGKSRDTMHAAKGKAGWRIVTLPPNRKRT